MLQHNKIQDNQKKQKSEKQQLQNKENNKKRFFWPKKDLHFNLKEINEKGGKFYF